MKFPDVVRIEPSSACNLRCRHCPTGTLRTSRGIMSQETFDRILSQLPEIPRVAVMYHGGEPTLNPNFWDWVRTLKNRGVKYIKTDTNGMLLKRSLDKVIPSGLDELVVSLDGNSKSENDSIRKGSNGDIVIENVKALIRFKKESKSETPKITINSVRFDGVLDVPEYLRMHFNGSVNYKVCQPIKWGGEIGVIAPIKVDGHCPFIDETITIRWNGDVVPCCYDITSKCILGNIHKKTLQEIWDSPEYEYVRQGIRDNNPVPLCQPCCEK